MGMAWGAAFATLSKRSTNKDWGEKNHSSFVSIIAGKICISTTSIALIYTCEYCESKAS